MLQKEGDGGYMKGETKTQRGMRGIRVSAMELNKLFRGEFCFDVYT